MTWTFNIARFFVFQDLKAGILESDSEAREKFMGYLNGPLVRANPLLVGETRGLHINLGISGNGGFSNLNWIQTIRTNRPNGNASSPYNDPQPSDDELPFYYTNWVISIIYYLP